MSMCVLSRAGATCWYSTFVVPRYLLYTSDRQKERTKKVSIRVAVKAHSSAPQDALRAVRAAYIIPVREPPEERNKD